jgi:hypothetical protein
MGVREYTHLVKSRRPTMHELIPRLHCLENSVYMPAEIINILFSYAAQIKHGFIYYSSYYMHNFEINNIH